MASLLLSKTKDNHCKLSTFLKWEKEFNFKFEYDVNGTDVVRLRCSLCKQYETQIKNIKTFSIAWIRPGTPSIKKDSVRSHCNTLQHKEAHRIDYRSKLGLGGYQKSVVKKTLTPVDPRGKYQRKIDEKDRDSLQKKFNAVYYLAKKERPFTDFPDLLELLKKNGVQNLGESYATNKAAGIFTDYIGEIAKDLFKKDFIKARYYSVLSDGSCDSATIEQELVYVLYLLEGSPCVKLLSVESPDNGNASGLKNCLKQSFERVGISDMSKKLVGLNVDGASVNLGIHSGLGALLKLDSPWLQLIYCFNHRLELALKDAFEKTAAFEICETFLLNLRSLYEQSPKRLRELKLISEAWETSIPKPAKSYGTRWLDHKWNAMNIALENYGAYISHLESLSQTDSQPSKRAELKGFLRLWKKASLVIHLSVYLDVLAPLRRLSIAFQQDLHDPVKAVRRVQQFNLTMAKLRIILSNSVDKMCTEQTILTNYKKLIGNVTEKDDITFSPLFQNLIVLLDVSFWPVNPDCIFGDKEIAEIVIYFNELLKNGGCDTNKISIEWIILKSYIFPMLRNSGGEIYLKIWKKIFLTDIIIAECRNILDVFELLLLCPFTNAKVERMFSRVNRVKSDWRNKLSRDRLECLLRIGEKGCSLNKFDPNPALDAWYQDKIRRLSAAPHRYPDKRRKLSAAKSSIDLSVLTISDFERESDSSNPDV
nr:zinc finger protein 862-like [Hydra vulgaris]